MNGRYRRRTRSNFACSERSCLRTDWELGCDWNDISLLLEPSAVDQYRSLDLVGKSMFERHFWWFADPFFLTSGNERRTEHYSRLVYGEIFAASALTRRMRWGRDNREMLIRYGPTVGWERERSSMSLSSDYRIIGHHHNCAVRVRPRNCGDARRN